MAIPQNNIKKPLPKKPMATAKTEPINNALPKNENLGDIAKTKETNFVQQEQNAQNTNSNKEIFKKTKKPKNKKKIIFIVIFIIILMAGAGVGAYMLLKNINQQKLDTPTFKIIELANDTVIEVESVENAKEYKYYVYDGTKNIILSQVSSKNKLELKQVLKQPGRFFIKVQALAEKEDNNSDISAEKEFVNNLPLENANYYINGLESVIKNGVNVGYKTNTNIADDTISWANDSRVKKYYVCYGANNDDEQVLKIEVLPTNEETISFSLANIYEFGGGIYNISVFAVADEEKFYLDNNLICNGKEQVKIEYYETLPEPENLQYNVNDKILKFTLDRNDVYTGEFEIGLIYSDFSSYYKIDGASIYDVNQQKYVVDLSQFVYDGLGRITVKALKQAFTYDSSLAYINIE